MYKNLSENTVDKKLHNELLEKYREDNQRLKDEVADKELEILQLKGVVIGRYMLERFERSHPVLRRKRMVISREEKWNLLEKHNDKWYAGLINDLEKDGEDVLNLNIGVVVSALYDKFSTDIHNTVIANNTIVIFCSGFTNYEFRVLIHLCKRFNNKVSMQP